MTTCSARLAAIAVAVFACASLASAGTVTYFNFNSGDATRSGGTSGAMINFALATGSPSFANNGTTVGALNSDGAGKDLTIAGGASLANNGSSFTINFNSVGFSNLQLSYAAERSGTGFNSVSVFYSVDGSSFTLINTFNPPTAYPATAFTADLSSVAALNGDSTAAIKFSFTGATNAGGNVRFDNIAVQGDSAPAAVPLPPAVLAGTALLGVVGFLKRRRPVASV